MDGPIGTGTYAGKAKAESPRTGTGYPGNHGFSFSIPAQFWDGHQHTLYAYGIDATGDSDGLLSGSPKSFTIASVASVVLEMTPFSEITPNPVSGFPTPISGVRIFPDKRSPSDTINRRVVRVKSTVSPALANVPVYFRNFDVDDPSDNIAPVDPNGSAGNDNLGTPMAGTLSSLSALTDSNGIAMVEFTTTMQPGDNFAIAASTNQSYLNGVTINGIGLQDAGGNLLPTSSARRTEMLTVWRNLHLEADSMGVIASNRVDGAFTTGILIRSGRPVTLGIDQPLEINRFENGKIIVNGLYSYTVIDNTTNTVTFDSNNVLNPVRVSPGDTFTLYDDDDFNDDDGAILDGDTFENIPLPDTSLLQSSDVPAQNVFAHAFVRPIYDIGDYNDYVPVVLNTSEQTLLRIATYDFDSVSTEADRDFWTIYLLGSYQFDIPYDADPGSEVPTLGVVDYIPILDGRSGLGACIFMEVARVKETLIVDANRNNAATTAHEVGHLFNGLHEDGGLMAQGPFRTTIYFALITLRRIREIANP